MRFSFWNVALTPRSSFLTLLGGAPLLFKVLYSPSLCVEREAGDNASSVSLSGAACEGASRSGCKTGSNVKTVSENGLVDGNRV